MNEQLLRYLDATNYARKVLGDDTACRYFDRLNRLAETNSLAELKSIIDGWFKEIEQAIETGARFRAHDIWDAKEDAAQSAWVALLEGGKTDPKSANVAGQSAARGIVRTERRYVPFRELEKDDGSVETVYPCDIVDAKAGNGESELAHQFWKFIQETRTKHQIRELLDLSEDDWTFLVNYLAGFRKGRASRAARNRVQALKEKLRRHVARGMNRELGDGWEALFQKPSQTKKTARRK